MRFKLVNLFWVFGSFIFSLNAMPFYVLIDPGHGGSDRGAVFGNAIESQIALSVSQKLIKKIKQNPEMKAEETRNANNSVDLKDRVKLSEKLQPDLFVSLHVNSSDDKKAKGTEYYFAPTPQSNSSQRDADSLKAKIINDFQHHRKLYRSKFLAEKILEQKNNPSRKFRDQRRKIIQAPFYVVTRTKVPALLVELGFLTHPEEGQLLMSDDYQNQITEELYQGIINYKNQLLKNITSNPK